MRYCYLFAVYGRGKTYRVNSNYLTKADRAYQLLPEAVVGEASPLENRTIGVRAKIGHDEIVSID